MSAISWREQHLRSSAPSEQTLALHLRVIPWLGILCALALALYPHALVWPAMILGLGVMLLLARRGMVSLSPAANAGTVLFLVSLVMGAAAAGMTDPAHVRLTGYIAAFVLGVSLLGLINNPTMLQRGAAVLVIAITLAELVVLALLRGSLPSSPFTRLLQPFTRLFSGFPGISGDTLDVNARFVVHQYGLAHLALVAAPFGIALALSQASIRWRVAGALLASANVVLLLATQSRGAVLALALVGAIIGSTRSRWAW
ncbi:MAG: hypothetical protein ACKVVP_23260, partial [Chloroflexota bacterium]